MSDTNITAADALRVAVSDGDTGFVQVLTKRLDRLGWEHIVLTGAVPVERLVAMRLGAFVIDLALLGQEAWPYLERVSRELPSLPLIICTGQSTVAQRVRGLRMGADDWVTKPCHPEELIARIEAVARRRRLSEGPDVAAVVLAGEIEIRADQFQAFAHGRSVDLTRREFELIQLLAAAEGRVLEREEIYQRVWGYTMAHGDRSVDVFVRKLRSKLLRVSPDWFYIHTHFGVGYRFAAELAVEAEIAAAVAASDLPVPGVAPAPVVAAEPKPPGADERKPARTFA
ncbi:MAG TPA: response regulator transcription factor [Solirubrobacteraceae bacterium]|nr:response regulator transcription factor [Solirubrobacteraceae bacterium]